MSQKLTLNERKALLPKLFAALCIAETQGDRPGQANYLLTDRFLGVIGERASRLKRSEFVEWILSGNILDDVWEQVEKLGKQDETIGVVTFYQEFTKMHRVFLAECEKKAPGLFRLAKKAFETNDVRKELM